MRVLFRTLTVALISCLIGTVGLTQAAFAAPSNDNFGSSATLSSTTSGSQAGTNVDATTEVDEPDFNGFVEATVWYSWTAPSAISDLNVCVYGDGTNLLDPTLAVYVGNSFAEFGGAVASNDDGGYGMQNYSQLRFDAGNGVTYRYQVGGYSGDTGGFTLKWGSDCTAPQTTASLKVRGPRVRVTFSGFDDRTAPGDLTFTCLLDGSPVTCSVSPFEEGLASGLHSFSISAEDEAGNEDPFPFTQNFTVKSKKYG